MQNKRNAIRDILVLGPQRTLRITGRISFHPDWQISWYTGRRPEQWFWRCFADELNHSLVSSVTQATYAYVANKSIDLYQLLYRSQAPRQPILLAGSSLIARNRVSVFSAHFSKTPKREIAEVRPKNIARAAKIRLDWLQLLFEEYLQE